MQYRATWDALIAHAMYNLISPMNQACSVSRSECLALVTAVTFGIITVLDFVLGLSVTRQHAISLNNARQILQYKCRL